MRDFATNRPKQDPLRVTDLCVAYSVNGAYLHAVERVSFSIPPGETLCLVGESGSGKTSIALAIPRLLPAKARLSGTIAVMGLPVHEATESTLRTLRRQHISFIFQDPVGSLVPTIPVGRQLVRTVAFRSQQRSPALARRRCEELLEHVGLGPTREVWNAYPLELSGGMCQRVMIALALSVEPALVIADEPTSALDALTQERILDLLLRLQGQYGFGMLCVTHDLRIARRMAQQIGVMLAGELVELAATDPFFTNPTHPYSRRLVEAAAKLSI